MTEEWRRQAALVAQVVQSLWRQLGQWLLRPRNRQERRATDGAEPQDNGKHNVTDKHLALIDSRKIPDTPERTPVLSHLSESAEYYANLLIKSAVIWKDRPLDSPRLSNDEISMHNNRFVMAQWGLIARGKEAVPYSVDMLRSEIPEVREAAAGVLGAVGGDDEVVSQMLESLEAEHYRPENKQTILTLDTLVFALGEMKNKKAIPALAALVRDTSLNGDSRWEAALALGRLARKRFDKRSDPMTAAMEWLDSKDL